jgi:hypothetical protein
MREIVKFFGIVPLIDLEFLEPGAYSPLFLMPARTYDRTAPGKLKGQCSMNGLAGYVQQIAANDPIEARRSRHAQCRGLSRHLDIWLFDGARHGPIG